MALTADQTAVLELLLAGHGYRELADLLGLDEQEVRDRARAALTELGGADPDREVELSAYLLGHADPIGRADAVRHLRASGADLELAERIRARLLEIEPGASLPELPAPQGRRTRPRAPAPPRAGGPDAPRRNRLYAALAAGAVVLVVAVLAIAGAFSGDGDSGSAASGDTSASDVAGDEVERIPLAATGGGDATGEGVVGITTGDQPYLDLRLQNLEPAPRDQVYVVWFLFDRANGYPLSPIAPDNRGTFEDRFAVPTPAIPVLARMRFLNVSLAPVEEVRRAIERAVDREDIVIEKPGRTVLQNREPLSAAPAGAGQGG